VRAEDALLELAQRAEPAVVDRQHVVAGVQVDGLGRGAGQDAVDIGVAVVEHVTNPKEAMVLPQIDLLDDLRLAVRASARRHAVGDLHGHQGGGEREARGHARHRADDGDGAQPTAALVREQRLSAESRGNYRSDITALGRRAILGLRVRHLDSLAFGQ